MSNPLDISVVANNTVTIELSVLNADGVDFDMTGYTAKWTIRNPNSSTPIVTKTSAAGDITISTNTLTWEIKDTDTINLQNGDYAEYEHEMIVTDTNGNPITISNGDQNITWGTLTVRKQITVQ